LFIFVCVCLCLFVFVSVSASFSAFHGDFCVCVTACVSACICICGCVLVCLSLSLVTFVSASASVVSLRALRVADLRWPYRPGNLERCGKGHQPWSQWPALRSWTAPLRWPRQPQCVALPQPCGACVGPLSRPRPRRQRLGLLRCQLTCLGRLRCLGRQRRQLRRQRRQLRRQLRQPTVLAVLVVMMITPLLLRAAAVLAVIAPFVA
jgi:hypothetical protein